MRLELDSPPSTTFVNYNPAADEIEARQAETQDLLRAGIKAAQSGDRADARRKLMQVVEIDSRCESAWLWLASLSEYPEELLVFLENVLLINPTNKRALEWRAATNKLLASTFIQRGLDAAETNQPDYAAECFNKSLEYDQENAAAWTSLASLADSVEGKLVYLEKALSVEPYNSEARAAYAETRRELASTHLADARAAAVAGNIAEAGELLEAVLAEMPESEEAWILRAHFADSFEEKIRSFERVLEINPKNAAAQASLFSLHSILEIAMPAAPQAQSAGDESFHNDDAAQPPSAIEDDIAEEETASYLGELQALATDAEEVEDSLQANEFSNDIEIMTVYPLVPQAAEPEPSEDFATEAEPEYSTEPAAEVMSVDSFYCDSPEEQEQFNEPDGETDEFLDTVGEASIPEEHIGFIERPIWESNAEEVTEPDDFEDSAPDIYGIPMPETGLEHPSAADTYDPFKTVLVRETEPSNTAAQSNSCPFCLAENDVQAIACNSCFAILTLADLEMLLSNQSADTGVLRQAVENLERERASRELTPDELVTLGIGYLNLRNYQFGFDNLSEAARRNPNDVVLASHVNSLLIRLEEIKTQEEHRESQAKGKTILVVDDSPTVRKLISGKLEKCGHNVICSEDGIEAVKAIEESVPDLVLLDITMPRMDGYQVCKLIRANPRTARIPVVMISGKDGFFDKVRGRMAGTSGYITKPFGPETLMKAVESYLNPDQSNVE